MPLRWGPGPVFVHESIAAVRRWQLYAMRSFFVFSLLVALVFVCLVAYVQDSGPPGSISIRQLAEVGKNFFYAISTTQLMMVLLVAPAATAGSICLDRARGNLTHMLVSELADSEIVLGKLAARLLPVVALVAATIPVLALAGLLGGVIIALSLAGTAAGILTIVDDYESGSQFLMFVNGFQATFGLLLVSLFAPTVLAEERVRGSLDVLMTTPLSTDRIVLAKWWGAYRVVPALAILPAIGCLIIAAGAADYSPPGRVNLPAPAPLGAIDYAAYVCIPMAILLAQGAVVTSVGLVLATWIRRVGRAVAVSVTSCAFFAFGWIILVEFGLEILAGLGLSFVDNSGTVEFFAQILATACPAGGQICTFTTTSWPPAQSRAAFYICQIIVFLATIGFALVVLALTLATFNRCVGRVSERPQRAPRPPRLPAVPAARRMRQPVSSRPISAT
jgi:ABC-type transport system involved in multi-copper enzyme maturation permease subunit